MGKAWEHGEGVGVWVSKTPHVEGMRTLCVNVKSLRLDSREQEWNDIKTRARLGGASLHRFLLKRAIFQQDRRFDDGLLPVVSEVQLTPLTPRLCGGIV
jgi:hypothetical protein